MINDPSRHGLIIGDLSDSIPKGLNSPPVKDLINRGANVNEIAQLLAVLILKYSRLLHIGGTMTANDEPKMIAKMLISEYPLNSLDDFNIILQRGIMGKYGKVMGFDISVIFFWVQQYQEEWAEEKEKQLAKERNKLSEMIEPKEGEWSEETTKLVKEFQEKLKDASMKSVPKLTPQEIREEGQERVKLKGSAYIPDPINVVIQEKKLQAARSRGLDKLELNQIKSFDVEGQKIVARNYEEAMEIYAEVYL